MIVEVWSPGNSATLEGSKLRFYDKYGAEEYFVINPGFPAFFKGYLRNGKRLRPIEEMNGFVSRRLGVCFEFDPEEVKCYGPDGREFLRPDLIAKQRTEFESKNLELKRISDSLAAKLRSLGIDPESI